MNGRRSVSGYTEGDTVTYSCNTGYKLNVVCYTYSRTIRILPWSYIMVMHIHVSHSYYFTTGNTAPAIIAAIHAGPDLNSTACS